MSFVMDIIIETQLLHIHFLHVLSFFQYDNTSHGYIYETIVM